MIYQLTVKQTLLRCGRACQHTLCNVVYLSHIMSHTYEIRIDSITKIVNVNRLLFSLLKWIPQNF